MVRNTVNKRVTRVYSPEMLAEARSLYQGGMSLEAVGKKLGIPYSTLRYRGWVDNWGVRAKGKRDPRVEAAKAERLARPLKREERLMMAEASLVKAEDLEVLARKSLVVDSARLKVAISRRVGEIVARLEDPSVPVRSAAQGLGALTPILKLLYRWHEEPSLEEMKHAESPLHNMVNLELINTPPEKLRELAEAKLARQNGSQQTVRKGRGDGPPSEQHEGPPDGQATQKKEAPTQPGWEATLQRAEKAAPKPQTLIQGNPPSAATPNVQFGSPPLSPEERRKRQLEELARLRAEWRGQRR
jgi:hypothetical protein